MVVSWPNEETGGWVIVEAILMAKAQNIGTRIILWRVRECVRRDKLLD